MFTIARILVSALALLLAGHLPLIAQWERTSGPQGATLFAAWADSDTITSVSIEGRIHRYSNGTWREVGTTGVGAIRQIVRGADVVLGRAATGIVRSTDRGTTWTTTLPGYGVSEPWADNAVCAAGRNDTLFVSDDAGATWTATLDGFNSAWTVSIHDGRMLVNNGFMLTLYTLPTTPGTPLQLVDTIVPTFNGAVSFIGNVLLRGDTMYAATIGGGVQLSTDRGHTWASLDSGVPLDQGRPISITSIRFEGDEIWGLSQGGELYRFNGTTWTSDSLGEYAFDYRRTASGIVALTLSGPKVWDSDEMAWREMDAGLRGVSTTEMAILPDGLIVSGSQRLYRTTDNGGTWETVAPFGASKLAVGNGVVYALTASGYHSFGTVVRSLDNGITWETIDDRLPEPLAARSAVDIKTDGDEVWVSFSETFSFHGQSNWVNGGVIRSTDRGASWRDVSSGLPSDGITYVPTHSFVLTANGMIASTSSGIYRSTSRNGGWSAIGSNGLPVSPMGYVQATITDVFNGRPMARSSHRLYTSDNNGGSWNVLTEVDSAAGEYLSDVSVVVDRLYVLIGQWNGTTNAYRLVRIGADGATEDITSTLPASTILTRFIADNRYLYAGSQGESVWRSPLPAASVDPFNGGWLELDLR